MTNHVRLVVACLTIIVIGLTTMLGVGAAGPGEQSPARRFQEALTLMDARGDLEGAIRLFEEVARADDRSLAAHALFYLGLCHERLGRRGAARLYEQVIATYPDERTVVQQARARLSSLARTSGSAAIAATNNQVAWPGAPEGEPSRVSQDGSVVAFRSGYDFVLAHPSSGSAGRRVRLRPVLAEDGTVYDPVTLSPDASQAAFTFEDAAGRAQLLIVRLDTGSWRTLAELPSGEWLTPLEWANPARLLALRMFPDGTSRTEILDPEKGSSRPLVTHAVTPQGASLSPDGRHLVYDAPGPNQRRDIFIASLEEGEPRLMTGSPADELAPVWTADGSGVIFTSDRTGRTGLWAIDVESGRAVGSPRLVYADSGVMGFSLGLTADGAFYYFRQVGLVNVYRVEIDASGTPLEEPQVATERYFGTNQGGAWGPGERLVHLSRVGQSLTQNITVHDALTERTLDTGMRYLRLLKWAPDGTSILVKGSDSARRYGLHLVDPATGRTTPALTVPAAFETSIGQIGWSHEPATVLYQRDNTLFARHLTSAQERPVLEPSPGGYIVGFDTLASSGEIAYVEQRQTGSGREWTVNILEPDGTRRAVGLPSDGPITWPTWMPHGRGILVVRPVVGSAGEGEIWRVDRETGVMSRVGPSMRALRNIDVSDDGRHLTFTAGSPSLEAWVLSNFLHQTRRPSTGLRRPPTRRSPS